MASATPVPQRRPARRIAAIRTDQLRDVRDDREALLRPLLDRNRVTDLLARPADPVGDPAAAAVAYLVDVNAWLQRHHISLT